MRLAVRASAAGGAEGRLAAQHVAELDPAAAFAAHEVAVGVFPRECPHGLGQVRGVARGVELGAPLAAARDLPCAEDAVHRAQERVRGRLLAGLVGNEGEVEPGFLRAVGFLFEAQGRLGLVRLDGRDEAVLMFTKKWST